MKLLKNPVADGNENINLKTVVSLQLGAGAPRIIVNPLISYEESRIAQEGAALTSRVQESNIPE